MTGFGFEQRDNPKKAQEELKCIGATYTPKQHSGLIASHFQAGAKRVS
jgi:hypothetical protein